MHIPYCNQLLLDPDFFILHISGMSGDTEKDYQLYCQLLSLWEKENPIKTAKLQMLLLVNTILVVGVQLNGGFISENRPLYALGAGVCLIWIVSIGRTSLFQKVWQTKLKELERTHSDDPRFSVLRTEASERNLPRWLRAAGGVSSKIYLVGAPVLLFIGWLMMILI